MLNGKQFNLWDHKGSWFQTLGTSHRPGVNVFGRGQVKVTVTKHRNFVTVKGTDLKFGIWVQCDEAIVLFKVRSRSLFLEIEFVAKIETC